MFKEECVYVLWEKQIDYSVWGKIHILS